MFAVGAPVTGLPVLDRCMYGTVWRTACGETTGLWMHKYRLWLADGAPARACKFTTNWWQRCYVQCPPLVALAASPQAEAMC